MKASVPAAAASMIDVGGDLTVARLGYVAMRITGASGASSQTGTRRSE
jgi:hypothetical protein